MEVEYLSTLEGKDPLTSNTRHDLSASARDSPPEIIFALELVHLSDFHIPSV